MVSSPPIVVVTGANAGIGFGICKRLLFQLSYAHPPDAEPEFITVLDRKALGNVHISPSPGLTLVLACRSMSKAEAARKELYAALDEELARRKQLPGYDRHGDVFRANLRIDLQYIDMAAMGSVFAASKEMSKNYPYISHLIFNAGVSSFSHIDWWLAFKQIMSGPIMAVSAPRYNVANIGERSADGLGWIWQCNVFAHYTLFRQLEPLLKTSSNTSLGPARVIWMSSLESSPIHYDPADWQLLNTPDAYALSKFQMDILATRLDMFACERNTPVRHVVVQPGVCATNIVGSILNGFTSIAMMLAFWLARWYGSVHHTIHRETAGYSAVHMSLIPLSVLPVYLKAFATTPNYFAHSKLPFAPFIANEVFGKPTTAPRPSARARTAEGATVERPGRFGTETDRRGTVRLGITEVREWDAFEEESESLRSKFDALYRQFLEEDRQEKGVDVESFVGMGQPANGRRSGERNGHASGVDH